MPPQRQPPGRLCRDRRHIHWRLAGSGRTAGRCRRTGSLRTGSLRGSLTGRAVTCGCPAVQLSRESHAESCTSDLPAGIPSAPKSLYSDAVRRRSWRGPPVRVRLADFGGAPVRRGERTASPPYSFSAPAVLRCRGSAVPGSAPEQRLLYACAAASSARTLARRDPLTQPSC